MSVRGHTAIAAVVLLAFSTETPAPQVPASHNALQVPDAARKLGQLSELVELQTDAINSLNQKLIAIEQRIATLEKEKNNGR